MSTIAEREAATETAISTLRAAGLAVEAIDDLRLRVAGDFVLWPATANWRRADGSRQGYGVKQLIEAAKFAGGLQAVAKDRE